MKNYSYFLLLALNSFDGFRGAKMPKDITNETEYLQLRNAVNDGSIWVDEKNTPSWEDVEIKINKLKNDYEAEELAKQQAEQSAINKLKALGLTDAEVEAFRK